MSRGIAVKPDYGSAIDDSRYEEEISDMGIEDRIKGSDWQLQLKITKI